jgi:L-lactate dehydrogenase complex protein LldG
MSAREVILASVRRALETSHGHPEPVPRAYRQRPPPADLMATFVERVEDYKATVIRCDAADVEERIAAAVGAGNSVVVPDGFPYGVPGAVAGTAMSTAELAAMDAVVTTATVGIAITGTIVLDHGTGQGRRAMSLLPDRHVCVLYEEQVVAGVPQAVARLDPNRPQTWISGPSATSDIELNRVEGVHGPRNLHVILVSG